MSEKPFSIDTYPLVGYPDYLFDAARSYIACGLVRAQIYAGRAVFLNGELYQYVMSKPEEIIGNVTTTIQAAVAYTVEKGISLPNLQVVDMSPEMLAAQQSADMECIDYALRG